MAYLIDLETHTDTRENLTVIESVLPFSIERPSKFVLLKPADWHKMYEFSEDEILMVPASEKFDQKDYIFENYD